MPDAADGQDPAPPDEFDRELRELTEGRAGEPLFLEPSAAERARSGVAVRVKEAPAVPAAWAGRRRRRRGHWLASLVAAALLLVAGGLVWLRVAHTASGPGGTQFIDRVPGPAVPGTISPVDLFAAAPADPFAGTPADGWANGAAGIVAPPARSAGGFTAAQVTAAYATTRQLLIAASLDRQTLLGGPPSALARLLTAVQRTEFLAALDKQGMGSDGRPLSTRTWVASFAPGTAQLIGTVIKVRGTMSARAVTEAGTAVLRVEVSYAFAYAVQSPDRPAEWTRVVTQQDGTVDFALWDDSGGPSATGAPGIPGRVLEPWDRSLVAAVAGLGCGTDDGYIYPGYRSGRTGVTTPARPLFDPYSMAGPASGAAVCGPAQGA